LRAFNLVANLRGVLGRNCDNRLIMILLYFTAIYLVFMGDPRYHLSLMPFIAMCAGIGAGCLLGEYNAVPQPFPHS
jgi:hypothetical protein